MAHFPSLVQPAATATYQGGGVLPGPGDLTGHRARARARRAGCDAHEKNVVYRATMFCSLRTSGHWPRIPAAATLLKAGRACHKYRLRRHPRLSASVAAPPSRLQVADRGC